jgi:hypothetical protein
LDAVPIGLKHVMPGQPVEAEFMIGHHPSPGLYDIQQRFK